MVERGSVRRGVCEATVLFIIHESTSPYMDVHVTFRCGQGMENTGTMILAMSDLSKAKSTCSYTLSVKPAAAMHPRGEFINPASPDLSNWGLLVVTGVDVSILWPLMTSDGGERHCEALRWGAEREMKGIRRAIHNTWYFGLAPFHAEMLLCNWHATPNAEWMARSINGQTHTPKFILMLSRTFRIAVSCNCNCPLKSG